MASRSAVILLVLAKAAVAEERDPDLMIAEGHFRKGQELFARDYFGLALREFEAARAAKPLAAFEYNIGVCHERLGDLRQAIAAYERFADGAMAHEAAEARARIATLRKRIAEGPAEVAPAPRRPSLAPALVVGGATLALAAVGIGLAASVGSELADLDAQWACCASPALQARAADLELREQVGWALVGVAAAAAVVDVVLWALAARARRERPSLAVSR